MNLIVKHIRKFVFLFNIIKYNTMKSILIALILLSGQAIFGQQTDVKVAYNFKTSFEQAYQQNPNIPHGVLEAVAYNNSRMWHIPANEPQSCTGMPKAYGVMGLILDGQNWFKENLRIISNLSGFSINDIINSPDASIKAYAAAYTSIQNQLGITGEKLEDHVAILRELSHIHVTANDAANDYALNSQIYEYLLFLNNSEFSATFLFPKYITNFEQVFGAANLKILSAYRIQISPKGVIDEKGNTYQPKNIEATCPDYPFSNCTWSPTTNHYSGRSGHVLSAIAIHTVQGSYSSCVNWFLNTSSSASTQYVVRSSDGQLTQMVYESDAAWHVTTENYYTVGYEHEGFVDQPAYYTAAMYQSSAALTRDICTAWNINPLRTFYRDTLDDGTVLDYGTHSLGAEGSCVKIKGHQHYPNQSHTDPGPNWNWNYYFKLLNPSPTPVSYTAASGTFYDTGGAAANYTDDERKLWLIAPANATSVTLNFTSFALEANYDFMYIYDGNTVFAPCLGRWNTASPGTVTANSGKMLIEFRSDCATNAAGWVANWTSTTGAAVVPAGLLATVSACPDNTVALNWANSGTGWTIQVSTDVGFATYYTKNIDNITSTSCPSGFCDYPGCTTALTIQPGTTYYWRIWNGSTYTTGQSFSTNSCDNVPPVTAISSPTGWVTANFTASFTDSDNSAVEKSFYQVLDNNGTEWRANSNNGFFADNFDIAMNADWTGATGNWVTSGGYLEQKDTSNGNTNIYASLNQSLSNRYLYNFSFKLGSGIYNPGTANQRRFGFHFFSDNSSLPNRGNGYFIFFRQETSKLEFYKVTNDVFAQVKIIDNIATTINQLYDIKVVYDRITGKMDVYRDNILLGSWTDAAPYATGSSISFRTGNAHLYVSELKVYRSRAATANISVGTAVTNDIRFQNLNSSTFGAKIKSICNDAAGNLSAIAFHDLNVDWTPPTTISAIFDGLSNDIDTTYSNNEISANWAASSDPNSDVTHYWYCIGSTSGGTDIVNWTDNGANMNVVVGSLTLAYNQMYYVSVKAENGAGLQSGITTSDGVSVIQSVSQPVASFTYSSPYVCAGTSVNFINMSTNATSYQWTLTGPENYNSLASNPSFVFTQSGPYTVELIANNTGGSNSYVQTVPITIYPAPIANAGNDASICQGQNVTFYASGGVQYEWNHGITDGVQFTPLSTDSYIVTVTDTHGCTDVDTAIVTVNELPNAIAGLDITACSGHEVVLNASGGTSYFWDHGVTNNAAFIPTVTATYTVTVTNAVGCSDIASLLITVIPSPIAAFSVQDTTLDLPNAFATFTNSSTNASSYEWDFGDGNSAFDFEPWHTYTVEGYFSVYLYATSATCGTDTLVMPNYIHVSNPDNIANISSNTIMLVSPNPFSKGFTIYLNDKINPEVLISITDMLGRNVFFAKEQNMNGVIHINNLENNFANGIYTLQIKIKDQIKSLKIIKDTEK